TRLIEGIGLTNRWDVIVGSLLLFVILIAHPHGIADVVAHSRTFWRRVRPIPPQQVPTAMPASEVVPVRPATLSVEDLTVRFGSVMALSEVSLHVRPGEVVGLIGPNGAGKTTLIDAVTGFVQVHRGTVALDGVRIDRLTATKRARLGLRRS